MELHPLAKDAAGLGALLLVAWLAWVLVLRVGMRLLAAVVRRSPNSWDDAVLDRGVFHRAAAAFPLLIVHQGLPLLPELPPRLSILLSRLAVAAGFVVAARAFSAALMAANDVYVRQPLAKDRPIKGILQVGILVGYMAAAILALAVLMDRSPALLLSGLGAMSAILLLIFRDSILSFVAGIQITTNNLIRVGDWIEMPQFHADGDVIDIALNTIQVQNWDKTITTIPAHKFLENSFKNWRGMQEWGGRRIKRSIFVDVSTIRFLTAEEVEHFGRFFLLRDYIAQKKAELEDHNRTKVQDPSLVVNVRRLSNLGTLRAYVSNYLRQHPGIHPDMTCLVRQLQPTAEGLPLEIYAFTSDIRWAVYEGVQADIFDHVLSVAQEFGLRVFQNPSGHDFAKAWRGDPVENRAVGIPVGREKEPRAE
ncbi:mechanosensitive ion channel family protein [Vulgatibacter incomptus]|uniref:mechanosensitive ion channel family protein n=1 Tax=Vulgatibacter incomptus TaxID=1391653 RepID=UPI0012F7E93C|nr:mechanosensitive ion channel domain-containing protein [Vulgatibacter incomptus]